MIARYKPFTSTRIRCYYCGVDYNITRDHLYCHKYPQTIRLRRAHIIKACFECNVILSAFPNPNIVDRAKYLLEQYQIRYKKLLAMPYWSAHEVGELPLDGQAQIHGWLVQKDKIKDRLTHLNTIAKQEPIQLQEKHNEEPKPRQVFTLIELDKPVGARNPPRPPPLNPRGPNKPRPKRCKLKPARYQRIRLYQLIRASLKSPR